MSIPSRNMRMLSSHFIRRPTQPRFLSSGSGAEPSTSEVHSFLKAGLPLTLFSVLAVWVVKNGIEGRQREADVAKGKVSKSERQARMEEEKNDMMNKLHKIQKQDFDNTKRIERPEEILERRRRERERRNVWYRKWGRWIVGRE